MNRIYADKECLEEFFRPKKICMPIYKGKKKQVFPVKYDIIFVKYFNIPRMSSAGGRVWVDSYNFSSI